MKHAHMKKRLAICGAAVGALLNYSSATNAETLEFEMGGPYNGSGVAIFGETGLQGAFTTEWDFDIDDNVAPASHVGVQVNPYNFSLQLPFQQTVTLSNISNLNVQLLDDGGNVLQTGTTFTAMNLLAGDYSLRIGGDGSGILGGVYQGALWVHPVPEVPTWAMMAVGLGLVGLALRRKPRSEQEGVPVTGAAA